MRKLLLLVILLTGGSPRPVYHVKTDSWQCPKGYSVYASESELTQGKPFVHCVK